MIDFDRTREDKLSKLLAELEASVADCCEDQPEVGEDDIHHDIAQSIAYGIRDQRLRLEFCRVTGIYDPITGADPLASI